MFPILAEFCGLSTIDPNYFVVFCGINFEVEDVIHFLSLLKGSFQAFGCVGKM